MHERSVHRGVGHDAVIRDIELDDNRETVLALVERGEIGREPLRQHWKHRHARVDGGRVARRVRIGGGTECHQGVHIGNADQEADASVRQAFRDLDLIEIARLAIVDRRPGERAQVAHVTRERIVGWVLEQRDLAHHLRREIGLEAVRTHGGASRRAEQ